MTDKEKIEKFRKIIWEGFDEFSGHFEEDRSYTQQEIHQAIDNWYLEYAVQANAIAIVTDEMLDSFTNHVLDKSKRKRPEDPDKSDQ